MTETGTTPPVTKLTRHIFICTNERAVDHPRGSCKNRGSEALIPLFKAALSQAGIRGEVRAQKSGCLDVCEWGPTVVVYPEGIWYGKVQADDVEEIVRSHIAEGKPVKRLQIPGK